MVGNVNNVTHKFGLFADKEASVKSSAANISRFNRVMEKSASQKKGNEAGTATVVEKLGGRRSNSSVAEKTGQTAGLAAGATIGLQLSKLGMPSNDDVSRDETPANVQHSAAQYETKSEEQLPKEDLTKTKKYDFDSAEGLAEWKQDKLAFTGETELSDKDIEGLLGSINKQADGKGWWDENYSYTRLETIAQSARVYDDFAESQEFTGYDVSKFLTRIPDELHQVLKPVDGKVLKVDDIETLLDEYAVLQPFHKNEQVQERLDAISKDLKQYQEAANYRESYYDSMSESSEWVDNKKLDYRYETSLGDFKKAFQEARYELNGKSYKVSELLSNISENDRKNHTAAYDSKYGAFDPKDKKGLFDRIGDFFEGVRDVVVDVLESPIVQGVLTVAQFIPVTGPAATALKAVSVANAVNNTAKAIDKGDVGGILTGAASGFSGVASLSGASNLARTADNLSKAGAVARAIDDPSATNLLSAATSFSGGSTALGQNLNTALKVSQARDAALSDGEGRALGLLLQAGEIAFAGTSPAMSTQLGDAGDVINGVSNLAEGDVATALGDFSGFIDYTPIGDAVSRFGEDVVDAFSAPKPVVNSVDFEQADMQSSVQPVITLQNGQQARLAMGADGQLVYVLDGEYQGVQAQAVQPYPFSGASLDDQWPTIKLSEGDTLSQIAQNYGVSVDEILRVNPGLSDPDRIRADDVLNLPLSVYRSESSSSASSGQVENIYADAFQISHGNAPLATFPSGEIVDLDALRTAETYRYEMSGGELHMGHQLDNARAVNGKIYLPTQGLNVTPHINEAGEKVYKVEVTESARSEIAASETFDQLRLLGRFAGAVTVGGAFDLSAGSIATYELSADDAANFIDAYTERDHQTLESFSPSSFVETFGNGGNLNAGLGKNIGNAGFTIGSIEYHQGDKFSEGTVFDTSGNAIGIVSSSGDNSRFVGKGPGASVDLGVNINYDSGFEVRGKETVTNHRIIEMNSGQVFHEYNFGYNRDVRGNNVGSNINLFSSAELTFEQQEALSDLADAKIEYIQNERDLEGWIEHFHAGLGELNPVFMDSQIYGVQKSYGERLDRLADTIEANLAILNTENTINNITLSQEFESTRFSSSGRGGLPIPGVITVNGAGVVPPSSEKTSTVTKYEEIIFEKSN